MIDIVKIIKQHENINGITVFAENGEVALFVTLKDNTEHHLIISDIEIENSIDINDYILQKLKY